MQSKLILAVALVSIANISIAGLGCSKSNTRIIIADEQTLKNRTDELEDKDIDFIHHLGILPALAGKKILTSEINHEVDKAANDCWNGHIVMVKKWGSSEFAQQVDLAHAEFNTRFEQIKPFLIKILVPENNAEEIEG